MEEIDFGSWQPSRGAPSTLGEVYESSLDAQRKFQNVNAYTRNLMDAYDRVNDEVKKSLGADLINPFNRYRAQPGDAMGAPSRSVYDPDVSTPDPVKQWETELDALAGKHPAAFDWATLKSRPLAEVAKLMKASEDKQSDVSQRRGFIDPKEIPGVGRVPLVRDVVGGAANIVKDPAGMAASFAGSLRGSLESPVDALANVVGGVAGSASKSLVKNAIRNGLANAGVQSVLEPVVQANRASGGLEYGWEKAFEDIAGAFGTGAALDLAVRPAGRAAIKRFGTDTPDGTFSRNTPRGGAIFDAPEQLPIPAPRPKTPDLSPELIERARNDDVAALREIAEKTGIMDQPGVKGALDYAELGGKVDEAAIQRFKEMGVDTGEGMRTLAAVMRDPDRFTRMPEPIRPADAPLMRDEAQALIAERGEQITAMLAQLPGNVSRVVAHALDAGLPQVVPLVRDAIASMERNPTAAMTEFTAKIQAMDDLADMAIVHGSNNLVEVADALRRSPRAMDSNVPVSTDFMRAARDLAALEADAYAMVRSGEVAPAVGAEVANRVMPQHQARVLEDLRKAGATTLAEARAVIDDLIPSERRPDEMPLSGGSRIDDPAGPEAKAQTERLREEHADAIKEAEVPLKERDKAEAEVETIRGEIAKLEEKVAKAEADKATPEAFAELAAKRDELRAAETRLAELNNDLIPGGYSPMFAFIAERVEMQRARDVSIAVNDALRLADTILPENARVTVTPDRLEVDGVALDAMERQGDITLALHALDPVARLGHEGVHALVSRGLLSPNEVDLLAQAGRETKAFTPEIEARYRDAYKDRASLERQISEEAAAHFVEAKIKSPMPEVQTVVDRVRALIERVRNALNGYGFKTADDVRNAILRGDVAQRQARDAWMRSNDITAMASDGQTMAAFAGERAKTADLARLGRAKTMDAAGASRDAIWTETGWFKGVDGKWRFEISDRGATFAPDSPNPRSSSLMQRLDAAEPFDLQGMGLRGEDAAFLHELYAAAYPKSDDITIGYATGRGRRQGYYRQGHVEITYTGAKHPLDTLVHELQHDAQDREGFSTGANGQNMSIEEYRRVAGEVEARTVEVRRTMTPDQRAARPPWMDYDVPEDQQIVRFADGSNAMFALRDMDALGYTSRALDAARSLKQAKGTPEQMLAQLKAAGVRQAEMDATGLSDAFDGQKTITRDEIVAHLEASRVGLKEVVREDQFAAERKRLREEFVQLKRTPRDQQDAQRIAEVESRLSDIETIADEAPRWAEHSLDPANPTYRETVIHLPRKDKRPHAGALDGLANLEAAMSREATPATVDFRSGHFPEPNIVGHMMTSTVKDAQDRAVYLIDQIQSDWGQRLRDDGVKDEAKIKELARQVEDQRASLTSSMKSNSEFVSIHAPNVFTRGSDRGNLAVGLFWIKEETRFPQEVRDSADAGLKAMNRANHELERLTAELRTAEASAPGHPLVNTTDQWTNTTLRRAIRQAAEQDAHAIAIPSGKTVLTYNPGDEHGMEGFYDKIVPKNLRNLLQKIDKASPAPTRVDTLETPTKGAQGKGFTVFELTDAVKRSVLDEGQPMFALRSGDPDAFDWGDRSSSGSRETKIGNTAITYGVQPRTKYAQVILVETAKADRGQGSARAAMERFVAEADRNGFTLSLTADPMGKGGMSKADLAKFYKSFGFVENKGRNKDFAVMAGMIRPPRKDTMFAMRDPEPPKPPLHAEVAMLDRMGMLKDLAMACKG